MIIPDTDFIKVNSYPIVTVLFPIVTVSRENSMANRMDDVAVCVRCGGVIIKINPDYKMCSACQAWVEENVRELIRKRKSRHGSPTRYRLKVKMLKKP